MLMNSNPKPLRFQALFHRQRFSSRTPRQQSLIDLR